MRFTEDAQGQLLTVTFLTGLPIVAWVPDGQSTWLGTTAGGLLAAATSFGDDTAQARLEMARVLRRHAETFIRSLELLLEADG